MKINSNMQALIAQSVLRTNEEKNAASTERLSSGFKINHAKRFLQEGSKVKVEVFFRGRSIVYKEQGEIMLLKFAQELEEFGKVEMMPKLEGKRMQMMIAPKSTKK